MNYIISKYIIQQLFILPNYWNSIELHYLLANLYFIVN